MPEPVRCPACDHLFEASDASARAAPPDEVPADEISRGSETYHSARSRRGRTSPLARGVRWLTVVLAMSAIVAVIYQAAATSRNPSEPRTLLVDPSKPPPPPRIPVAKPDIPPQPAEPAIPPEADLTAIIRHGVVMLETEDADGTFSIGTGFLVESHPADGAGPLVVTNYHVLSAATSAYARFHDGSRHAVTGYRAIARELDLAAVELASQPVDAQPLALAAEGLKMREPVVSVGHPQGIGFSTYPGEVSTILQSSGLPASAREYLRQTIRGERNLLWIQHTARISEGNSGGPLLNRLGEVAGVNTWTNHEMGFSYALDGRQLRSLLEQPLADVAPLAEYTSRQALAAEAREQLSAEKLESLLAEAESFGLLASSTAEYRKLQELAVALTYAGKQPEAGENSARRQQREALAEAADRVALRLQSQRWNALGATTLVNDFALREYRRPLAGVFLFGVVRRVVSGDDGSRGMLLEIAGSEQQIFVPLDGLLLEPKPGAQCLIVGMNFQGQVVRYGENPLALTEVPVVVTARDGIIELKQ